MSRTPRAPRPGQIGKRRCKALNCFGPFAKRCDGQTQLRAEQCADDAVPGSVFCWTHESAIAAGTRTEAEVLAGAGIGDRP